MKLTGVEILIEVLLLVVILYVQNAVEVFCSLDASVDEASLG